MNVLYIIIIMPTSAVTTVAQFSPRVGLCSYTAVPTHRDTPDQTRAEEFRSAMAAVPSGKYYVQHFRFSPRCSPGPGHGPMLRGAVLSYSEDEKPVLWRKSLQFIRELG